MISFPSDRRNHNAEPREEVEVVLDLAQQMYKKGNYNQALDHSSSVYEINPLRTDNLLLLGAIYYQLHEYDMCIAKNQEAIQINPNFAECFCNMANAWKEKGNNDLAIHYYLNAIELRPNFADAWSNLVCAYMREGRLSEAARCCRKALVINPLSADAHNNLGNLMKAQGLMQEAYNCYFQALRIQPNFAIAWSNLAGLFVELGYLTPALQYYKEAVELKPSFPDAYQNLGNVYKALGLPQDATLCYQRAMALGSMSALKLETRTMPREPYICPDLLFPILKFFPVQSLVRCRSVCKSWKQVIDSTSFKQEHLSVQRRRFLLVRNRYSDYILLDADNCNLVESKLTSPNGGPLGERVTTAHGVVLSHNSRDLVLWNPWIRRQFSIPGPQIPDLSGCYSQTYFGFWIDPLTTEFKIVLFCFKGRWISLYTSRGKNWVKIAMDASLDSIGYCQSAQVLIDRVSHWMAATSSNTYTMVFFDFERDKFGTIDLPTPLNGGRVNVFKWRGLLSIVLTDQTESYFPMEHYVYVMQQNGVWTKKARIPVGLTNEVVYTGHLGSLILAFMYNGELVVRDPLTNKNTLVVSGDKFKYDRVRYPYHIAFDFVESLIFPD